MLVDTLKPKNTHARASARPAILLDYNAISAAAVIQVTLRTRAAHFLEGDFPGA